MNESFVYYQSFLDATEHLSDEEFGRAMRAIAVYGIRQESIENMDSITRMVFTLVRPQIDANFKRRECGSQGGRPSTKPTVSENDESKKPTVSENDAEKKPNVNVNANVNANANAEDSAEPSITITLNTGDEYPVYPEDITEYEALYPAVDVMQELRKMRGWCNDNPTKRKTKTGIRKFIGAWLSREQDRGGSRAVPEKPPDAMRGQERKENNYAAMVNAKAMANINARLGG